MSVRSEVIRIFNELIGQAKKIVDLPALPSPVDNADLFEVSRSGTSYKATGSQLPSGGGGGAVDSVNGQTGVVVLDAGDVGADVAGAASTVATNLSNHISDATAAHAASAISNAAAGGISATTVQAAIDELDSDKLDKLVTTNRQTASYGLVLADANKLVEMNVAGANNLTVPLNATQAFAVGTSILIAQYGAGQTTVVATGGVTIRSSAGKLKLTGQNSMATLIKIATDEWYLSGDITT